VTTPSAITNGIPGNSGTDKSTYSDSQLQQLVARSKNKDRDNKIIAWTKNAHMRCRTIRQQTERQWYVNLAFYIGRQNVTAVPMSTGSNVSTGMRLWVPPAPYYRSRPVFNRIRPAIRSELSKLTSQRPSATVVPSTSDEKDLIASRAAEQIWDSVYRRKKLKLIHRRAQLWALTCGVGFIKTYWDPNAPDPDNPDVPGDMIYDVVTPFHLFIPDMLAEDIEDQPYVMHITTRTPEWVKLNYKGVNATPNVMEAADVMSNAFLNLVGAGAYRKDAVLCYEVWIKPGNIEFMPKGGMFTIIGDQVVQYVETGNPYLHSQYPFTKFDHIPTGRFYSDSVINDLIPIQREYNRTRGQVIEAKNRMAHPQLIAAEGSIDATKITTEPGQVIQYKLGFPKPEPLPMQNMPAYVIQELSQLLADFEDISGQHDVSRGQTPPGVTAATAISFLQEQDETMLSPSFASIEEAFEKIGYQTLCHVKQYWDTDRYVKVVGTDGQFNVMTFQGSDLRSNTDIRIEAGSALPTSKSAKQALLMDLMTQGFIPPEKGLELMDVGGVTSLYEQLQVDSSQAMRENMKMAAVTQDIMEEYLSTFQGPPDPMTGTPTLIDPNTQQPLTNPDGSPSQPPLIVPVNTFDNHMAHISTHNQYRKSQEFDMLEPPIRELFEEHVNQHMAAIGQQPGAPDPTTNQPPQMPPQGGPPGGNMPPGMGGPPPNPNGPPGMGGPPGMPPPH
jgi:hypothetical protein